MRRNFDRKVRSVGLTKAQWEVLMHLHFHPEGLRQRELADLMDIKPMSLVRLLDRLEKGGWLERRCDLKDRRAKLVFLVEGDKPEFSKVRAMGFETMSQMLKGISGEEQEMLFDVLQRMRENFAGRKSG